MFSLLKAYFQFIKKFLPKPEVQTAVGLDIGAFDCKIVELLHNGDSFELLTWAIEPIVKDDLSAAIQKCIQQLKHPCARLFTAIAGKGTLIRYIDMPMMSIEDLKNSFGLEADKYFPFPQDQIYTDCFIIDSKGKNMSVLVAAAKKDIVEKRVTLLKELGFQPDFIGLNPLALANIISVLGEEGDNTGSKATALLDIGESVTNLTISIEKLPRFTRDIFIGGKDFTKRIGNTLGVAFDEAEKLKKDPGEKAEAIHKAVDLVIMDIIHEMRLSFDYFMTEENVEIGKIYLTGGGSRLADLKNKFHKNLDVEVETWDPFGKIACSEHIKKEELLKFEPQLAVALGLALYDD